MRAVVLGLFTIVVACSGVDMPPEREVSPIDAVAIDVPTDSTSPRTCNLDPRGRVEGELARARDALLAHYATNGMFPATSQVDTPVASCCTQNVGGLRCCWPVAAEWTSTPWMSFGFSQTAPQEFQFSYSGASGGQSLWMTATGNLDCDATTIVYTLRCTASSGVPACELTSPTNAD